MPHVSWWQIGNDVLAMSEYPKGFKVDPHNAKAVSPKNQGEVDFTTNFPSGGWELNPAHQVVDEELGLISTTGNLNRNISLYKMKKIMHDFHRLAQL